MQNSILEKKIFFIFSGRLNLLFIQITNLCNWNGKWYQYKYLIGHVKTYIRHILYFNLNCPELISISWSLDQLILLSYMVCRLWSYSERKGKCWFWRDVLEWNYIQICGRGCFGSFKICLVYVFGVLLLLHRVRK